MKTKLRRFVSILSAMVLMICCAVPAFAFSNSDLPLGQYKSDDDFTYKEIIPQLIEKYPDYFLNLILLILNTVFIGLIVMIVIILRLSKMKIITI